MIWSTAWPTLFQSAPRCEHRGDSLCPSRLSSPARVSIRAPVRTPGRQTLRTGCWTRTCSIRAPVRTPGRPRQYPPPTRPTIVSIRAPVRTPGRLRTTFSAQVSCIVSIRAPVRTPGRPGPSRCPRPPDDVSIRAPVRTPGRLRSALPVRPQDVTSPLPRTCQSTSDRPRLICQRTGETDLFCSAFRPARNMGGQAGTGGSRRGVHKINGSVRSTGLATP